MTRSNLLARLAALSLISSSYAWTDSSVASSQSAPDTPDRHEERERRDDAPPGPGGERGRGGRGGGPGGPHQPERKLVARFDADGNGRLDRGERHAAREAARAEGQPRRGGPGGGMGREGSEPTSPGPKLAPSDVEPSKAPLYDAATFRTIFIDFDDADWEAELADFVNTDVEVPAAVTVDGVRIPEVGIAFRGASSYFMVPAGSKRSFNISVDAFDKKARIGGYRTLNLLNSHSDPSFLHAVLAFDIAQALGLPAPDANLVRVVVNGESWGVFVNAQQFNKDLIAERFSSAKGARWKVPGSPNGRGGLEYLGDDPAPYRERYELKSDEDEASWSALIALCRVLNETPLEELESAIAPMLDLEGAMRFLAFDCALANGDGYWTRASDYCLFRDAKGVFHLLPHDANETFSAGGGPRGMRGPGGPPPGMGPPPHGAPSDAPPPGAPDGPRQGSRRGPGGGGATLDPLVGLEDPSKPLRSRLLKVPALRERYLREVRTIAESWLDWEKIGPIAHRYRDLIDAAVRADTRKLASYDEFRRAVDGHGVGEEPRDENDGAGEDRPARRGGRSLREFCAERRAFLLAHPEIAALAPSPKPASERQENAQQ